MDLDKIESELAQAIQAFIKADIKISIGEGPLAIIKSKTGRVIKVDLESTGIDLIFELYGKLFHYPETGNEIEYYKTIINYINKIIKEELISIQYLKGNIFKKENIGEIIDSKNIENYRSKKNFKCVSWNDTYSNVPLNIEDE